MKKLIVLLLIFFISHPLSSQIVINELDCDTPGVDDKEFIEIKSETPKFSLNGYIIVFFNGSSSGGNSSYFSIDLNGYKTDLNGIFLIGSNSVSPVPQLLISENTIQNGADAVAIYKSDINAFPERTLATTENLIDALVYDTNDPDAESLMALLGETEQINEGMNGKKNTESIQRANDGTYYAALPTPRQLNDGSGIVLNGLSISFSEEQYIEGSQIELIFNTELNVSENLDIEFTLNNGSFDNEDYSGNVSVTIPKDQNTTSTTISIIDDIIDEGDEVMVIRLPKLPDIFIALNDNIEIRIVDNDFKIAPWGTPINPTYDKVESTQPVDYYNSLNGLSDNDLRNQLQNIVANPDLVRAQTYSDIIEILKEADQSPTNSNQVWMVYTEQTRPKLDFQTSSDNNGKWNREHTFPRSLGGFYSIKDDDVFDGKDIFWNTNADSLRHANSDAHGLRVVDGRENSRRGNQHYGEYNGPDGNLGSFKGDVARSVLYMALRYNGLEIVNGFPDSLGKMGDLATILDWHRNDPPDDYEMNRNNIVFEWQYNRNPFIDEPDLVEYIWGDKVGNIWNETKVNDTEINNIFIYPNPTTNNIFIEGITSNSIIEVYSILGNKIITKRAKTDINIDLNAESGMYIVLINTKDKVITKKVIVR